MIKLKYPRDIEYIEHAIDIVESILCRISRYMRKGVTPDWIDRKVGFLLLLNMSKSSFKGYENFPANTCISVNTEIIHCVPDDTPFETGDVVKVDLGVNYKGYMSDQARTYIIDLKPKNPNDYQLLYATRTALERAVLKAKAGNYIKDISLAIEDTAKEFGMGILKNFGGHGVGFEVHEAPHVPNEVGRDATVKLKKGMVLAIEPIFVLGSGHYTTLPNGGITTPNIGCHFENTVIIK